MNSDYIKLWLKSKDSGFLSNTDAWQLLCWRLLNATRKTHKQLVDKTESGRTTKTGFCRPWLLSGATRAISARHTIQDDWDDMMEGRKMLSAVKFTLPVAPTAQARHKVAVRDQGSQRFAQASKTKDQQINERILEAWLKKFVPEKPVSGPLCLEFVAGMPIPKSAGKKTQTAMFVGYDAPNKKPDLNNLVKQLKDAMTRLRFWHDDAQIVCLRCEKIYAKAGCWQVSAYEAVRNPI